MVTGWQPKMRVVGPVPLNFDCAVVDELVERLCGRKGREQVVYLGKPKSMQAGDSRAASSCSRRPGGTTLTSISRWSTRTSRTLRPTSVSSTSTSSPGTPVPSRAPTPPSGATQNCSSTATSRAATSTQRCRWALASTTSSCGWTQTRGGTCSGSTSPSAAPTAKR